MNEFQGWIIITFLAILVGVAISILLQLDDVENILRLMDIAV